MFLLRIITSIWELKLTPSSLRRYFFLEGFSVTQISFWRFHLLSLSVWDFQMYLNPKKKYYLGLSQNSIYNLADILYTPVSYKSNCFICLPKSGQKPSEDCLYPKPPWILQGNAMPLGLSGDCKQGFSSMYPNLIIVSFPS